MPLNAAAGGEAMAHRNDPTGRALELARSATPARARHRTTLATVARPAAEVAGLLLVEVLGNPRARAAALDVARSLARWLADRRPPAPGRAEVTTGRVMVVRGAGTSVLVHRVEGVRDDATMAEPTGPMTFRCALAVRSLPPARRTAATISLVSFERQRFGAARRSSAMRLLRRHR